MTDPTLSGDAERVLAGARHEAARLGTGAIGSEHILLGLLQTDEGAAARLRKIGVDPDELRQRLESAARRARARGGESSDQPAYTSHAKRLIELASNTARDNGTTATAGHLLFAALSEPRGALARALTSAGVRPSEARAEAARAIAGGDAPAKIARRNRRQRTARSDRAARAAPPPEPDEPPEPRVRRPLAHLEAAAAKRQAGFRWRRLLLLAVPASILLESVFHAGPVLIFAVSCIAILPLAGLMGEATEHLAQKTGPTVGGLLNATFGNAAELIIAVVALSAGQIDLVKASITGSIIGNLLLIQGLSLVAASRHSADVRFNRTAAGMSTAMMALAVVALVFPALFHATHPAAAARTELWMSEAVAVILALTYGCSLLFSLKTHRRLFGGDPHPVEGAAWSVGKAVLVLGLATVGVAWESEILVHAVEAVTESLNLSTVFLGLIVIPIIGNAAEHAAAVVVARKGQTDLALQIALGSSTQIALLVAPLLVLAGVLLGQRGMNLVFQPFEVAALGLATLVTSFITLDGESHWFEGVQLLAVYALVAVGAFFI